MDKTKVQAFLEDLAWSKNYIVWWLNYATTLDNAIWKSSQYLVAGADVSWIRVSDKHFTTKKYFYIDLDIRADVYKTEHRVIDDTELENTIDVVIHQIKNLASDFSYIVATGNWLHIYYVGKEQEFTKEEYSNAMTWIIKMFDDWLKELWFTVDEACKNIWRLSRLPWSINDWRKIYDNVVAWDLWPREAKFLYYEPKESIYFNEIKSFIEVNNKEAVEDNLDDIIKTFYKPTQKIHTDWLDDYIRKVNDIDLLPIACSYLWMTAWKERGDWIIPLQVFDGRYWNAWVYYHKPTNKIVAKWNKKLKKSDWEWYNTRWFIKTELCNGDKDQAKRYIKDTYWIWWEAKQQSKNVILQEVDDDYLVEYNRWFKTDYTAIVPFTRGTELLDKRFWRIDRWMFITTIWESWSWKTTFAFHQLLELSKKYKVLFVSLEMSGERVIELRSRKMAWITTEQWNNKTMSLWQIDAMERNKKLITENANLQIVWVNKKAESIDVDKILLSIKNRYNDFDYITIDNLWFIKAEWPWRVDERKEANYIIRQIKNFCQDNNKNINLLHHFNKWNESSRRERTFADVMLTSKLEHDIDYAIFVSRAVTKPQDWEEASPEERAMVFIDLMKDRNEWQKLRQIIYFNKWWYVDNFIL